MKKIIVEGHRGYSAKYPENTLVSFEAAVELGVDVVEFDIWLSKDNVPVIMHDGNVERTTDGEGHIRDKTLKEIKQLDAGKWFNEKFSAQSVPTLEETLELLTRKNPKLMLGVEIKEYSFKTVDLTMELLNSFKCLERCFFYCFNARIIKYLKQKYSVITMGYPDFKMKEFEPDSYRFYDEIGISIDIATPEFCRQFEKMGFPLHIYCADNEDDVAKAIECGAKVITANDPVPLINILNEKGMRINLAG